MHSTIKPSIVTSQALADLGPVIAGACDLQQTAAAALEVVMSCVRAKAGALFCIQERPTMLASVTSKGFASFPQTAIFPLLPKHLHALTHAEGPQNLGGGPRRLFFN